MIGSVHCLKKDGEYVSVDLSEESLIDSVNRLYGGDLYAMAEDYFAAVAEMAETTMPDVIGHFDLIAKFNSGGHLFDERHPRYVAAATRALERAIQCCDVFELNSGAIFRRCRHRPYPSMELLRQIAAMGGQIMLNSDAHTPEAIGFYRGEMAAMALQAGFTHEVVVTAGGIRPVPLLIQNEA